MRIEPEITGASLVLLGDFNPSILVPAWFGWHGLLSPNVVDNAELILATPEITEFNADWLNLQVLRDRLLLRTFQSPFVRLRDLAVRVFREQLPHTRLSAMGINREVHFPVKSYSERDQIGRRLAPIEPWGEWSQKLELAKEYGGMASITMTQRNPEGRPPGGQINVTVEPSALIRQDLGTGVYVHVNDHYTVEDPQSQSATGEIVSLLEAGFDKSIERAEGIIDHIMSLGKE